MQLLTSFSAMRIVKFIALWFGLSAVLTLLNGLITPGEILINTVKSLLLTAGFYVSYFVLVKKYLYKGKTVKFVLILLLVTAVVSFLSMLFMYQVYVYQKEKFFVENFWKQHYFFTSSYTMFLLVIGTMLGIRFLNDRRDTLKKLEEVEKEKITNELSFLKAQINPHFLFNSLNNILFQIDRTNKEARETLLKFSEMLRYQLYDCSTELIDIEKEIQYIKNYIEIQMLRKTDKYECSFTLSESVNNFQIAPLMLIPFIENAFKHVSNHSNKRNSIVINGDYKDGEFIFKVKNDKDSLKGTEISENKGIGLVNVRRRLDLLYENKYHLGIENNEKEFSVTMKVQII